MNNQDVIKQPTAPTPVACSAWLDRADLHTKTEWLALLKADEALECAKQFNRGDCHLEPIRKLIAGRMRILQTKRSNVKISDGA